MKWSREMDDQFTKEDKEFQLKLRTVIWAMVLGALYGIGRGARWVYRKWGNRSTKTKVSFWLMLGLLVGGTLYGGYWLDERARRSKSLDEFLRGVPQATMPYGGAGDYHYDWTPGNEQPSSLDTLEKSADYSSKTVDSRLFTPGGEVSDYSSIYLHSSKVADTVTQKRISSVSTTITPTTTTTTTTVPSFKAKFKSYLHTVLAKIFPSAYAARLPIPGADTGTWGDILNTFLLVEHSNAGGTEGQHTDVTADSLVVDTDTLVVDKVNNLVCIGCTTPYAALDITKAGDLYLHIRQLTPVVGGGGGLRFLLGTGAASNTNVMADIRGIMAVESPLQGFLGFFINTGDSLTEKMRLRYNGTVPVLMVNRTTNPSTFSANSSILANRVIEALGDGEDGNLRATSYGAEGQTLLRRANGTEATPTSVLITNRIGGVRWDGYHSDGTPGFLPSAGFQVYAKENFTATVSSGYILIKTTPTGAGNTTTKITVDSNGVIFNDDANDYDTRFEGVSDTQLLFVDASTDRVCVGCTNPDRKLVVDDDLGAADGFHIRNRSTADGRASILLTADRSSTHQWNFGIDLLGGVAKGFEIRDATNGVIRQRIKTNGQIQLIGGQLANRTAVSSSPYEVLPADYYLGVDTSAARELDLPSASGVGTGTIFVIKDETGTAATYNITIDPNGAELIDGNSTFVITANYAAISIISTGTGWAIY